MKIIENFSIMFFAVTMGFGGFNIALFQLSLMFDFNMIYFEISRIFTSLLFLIIFIFYTLKICFFFEHFKADFSHQVKLNFFATFSISLLILANLWQKSIFYEALFYLGLGFQTYFTFYTISFWINKNLEIKHSNPAWFIPIVGNLLVIVGADFKATWLWFYFSLAMFFWLVLFAIIFYRILFHEQLANKFMPTLFIMIAPAAVGFVDYIKLNGGLDNFALFLLNLAIFFTLLVIFMFKNFLKLKFFLSWWAFTFPSAALVSACLKAYEFTNEKAILLFGLVIFAFLCVLILFISFHTIKNIINGEVFRD